MTQAKARKLLASAIERSGLSAREFALHVLMRDERTVRRWQSGDSPIPSVVWRWLDRTWPAVKESTLHHVKAALLVHDLHTH